MPRIKPVDVDNPAALDAEQRRVYDALMNGPRGRVTGPFPVLLRLPEVCDCIQRLGAYLRFNSSLSGKLGETAILITARYWDCHYEWSAHEPMARKEGAADATIAAIRAKKRPDDADAALMHDVIHALYQRHAIDDALYAKAVARLGEDGMLELAVLVGYYAMIGQVFATAEVLPAAGKVLAG